MTNSFYGQKNISHIKKTGQRKLNDPKTPKNERNE